MINHARSLLLNQRDGTDPAPWERYFPVDYASLVLPPSLEGVRASLVGKDGWWDRTYRVEMLLTMMDSPRYEGKFSWMDQRTTPPQVLPFLYYEPAVSVTRAAAGTPDPYVTYLTKDFSGVLPIKRTWQVLGSGGSLFTVIYAGRSSTMTAYFSTENNGWVLPLAPDFDLLFSTFGSVDDSWSVSAYKKPINEFANYPAIVNSLPGAWTASLFSVSNPSETPINEYARWYNTCVHAEDRIIAVVLSYILKTTLLLG